jgi:cobalt transport protein ATP-binding subunit
VVVVGFSVGFGTTPLFSAGPLTFYKEGIFEGLSAGARVASDMCWIAVVFLTTPFTRVLEALKWYRMPAIMIETISMSYRYAFLLGEEFGFMRNAARGRGGFRSYKSGINATSMILAQVILRAYERSKRVQDAMTARGAMAEREGECQVSRNAAEASCPNKCDVTPEYPEHVHRGQPVLSCRDMSFRYAYSGANALNGVSTSIFRNEVVVVCGPNGSGKTTLLKLFAGILMPEEGEIAVNGRKLDKKNRAEMFRQVGILFQDPNNQLFCTHVFEDIAYGPRNLGLSDREVESLVQTAMELMEVKHLAHRPIHRLSHGEMKRVGLAGLIAMRPPILLLDEPTAGLDPEATKQLMRLMLHLKSHHGYTFVVVSHDINMASLIADRIIVLDEGRIAADGPVRDVVTDESVLRGARLELPILTLLFKQIFNGALRKDQIPVTVDEAVEMLDTFQNVQH